MKKTLLIAIIFSGIVILLTNLQSKAPSSPSLSLTNQLSPTRKAPSSYKIEGVSYAYGNTGCCYCAGMTAMMAFRGMGKQTVENYWQDIKASNYEKDPIIFIRLLPKYGLSEKFHVAWLNPNKEKPRFATLWKKHLANYQKQVHYLNTEEEAFNFLKQLISQNIPVMVAYEEPPNDTFHLIYGYDENLVYYWALPGKTINEPIAKFLKGWRLDQEEFPYPNFPGHYTMMWLEK